MKDSTQAAAPAVPVTNKSKPVKEKKVTRDLRMYHFKQKIPKFFYSLFRFFFIVCMAYVLLSPILIMLTRSLRTAQDMLNPSIVWIPSSFTFDNIIEAFKIMDYSNTLVFSGRVVLLSTLLTLISCSMAGYALARYHQKISNFCIAIAILTIIVPMQTYIIPVFFQFRLFNFLWIGDIYNYITGDLLSLNDTEFAYYLPAILGAGLRAGLFVVVFMQFFKGLPKELEDAARVDGCSEARTFVQVMLPNSGSVFLVVSIFSIVWYWNDYFFAQIMMKNKQMMSTKISMIKSLVRNLSSDGSWGDGFTETVWVFAGALLFILPPLILYIIVQRFFIQSIERTGIVG